MKPTLYSVFSGLLWLALPVTAARLLLVWRQLPARVAIHFDLAGQPNGWTSPTGLLIFLTVLLASFAVTATILARRVTSPDLSAWTLLGFLYVVAGIFYGAADGIVRYNLYGVRVHPLPFLIAGFGSAFVLVMVGLGTRRGPHLPTANLIAEEVHGSRGWALIMIVPCILLIAIATVAPSLAVRLMLAAPVLLMLLAALMAWSGFHYFFSGSGLEIRTLGFRLRTVPASQIRNYAADTWSPARGYGIRGVGKTRAYVWGKKGVRIDLWDGEIFLGHADPERLVRDLDAVMSVAH